MFENNQVASTPKKFTSAKTTVAIPIPHPAIEDALVQLTLDPHVLSIDYIASTTVESEPVDLGAIVVQGEGGDFLVDVVAARPIRDLEHEGLVLIGLRKLNLPRRVIRSEDLRREPNFSNSRLVWLYSRHHVPLDLRIRILTLLSQKRSMKLGELLQEIEGGSGGSRAVMALACSDLLELDLKSQPLGPTTLVRSRAHLPDRVEPLIPSKKKI